MSVNALFGPSHYFEGEIYDREKESLSLWIYVGLIGEFEERNDFKAQDIFSRPVVVQRFKSGLRAFKNVCSHRFSPIQKKGCGNRALLCPYHGWAYNEDGIPAGIPKKPFFDLDEKELANLKLEEYPVDQCGNLIFVNLGSNQSLREFLGEESASLIERFELLKENRLDSNSYDIKCNWKIIVENTLEAYHVQLVHADTFNRLGVTGNDFLFGENTSTWVGKTDQSRSEKKAILKLFENRSFKTDNYLHILLFPNTLISTYKGLSYNISQIFPLSSQASHFQSEVFLAPHDDSPLAKIYGDSLVDFNRKVFLEDAEICEGIQNVIKNADKNGILSDEEERVHHFQRLCLQCLGENV